MMISRNQRRRQVTEVAKPERAWTSNWSCKALVQYFFALVQYYINCTILAKYSCNACAVCNAFVLYSCAILVHGNNLAQLRECPSTK